MEDEFTLVECFATKTNKCRITGPCRLKRVLREALNAYLAVLDDYALSDLTERNPALSKLLLSE
jgi:Rrf2 family nitric oxide-sensitive transcriptional repressor